MNILDQYLNNYRCKIYRDEEAYNIYINNVELCNDMCGDMSDQLDSLVATYDKQEDPDAIILLITNANNKPIAIFHGIIEDDKLISNITCSTTELKKGGVLLRFYALLIANNLDNEVNKLTGAISGGIPPLMPQDSTEVVQAKKQKLINYHLNNGATINDKNEFTYNLDIVEDKIRKLFIIPTSGGKKRKTKTIKRSKKRKIIKKRTRYSRRK